MSGNPALDRQIMQAVQPQFNPMQAISQMQRPMVQPMPMRQPMPVQNPVFGGAIPMSFGLQAVNQIPEGYKAQQMARPEFVPGVAGLRAEYDKTLSDLQSQLKSARSELSALRSNNSSDYGA